MSARYRLLANEEESIYGHSVFGEAAMFTAQVQGAEQASFGLNSDKAKDNVQLLLNVMHWLDGTL